MKRWLVVLAVAVISALMVWGVLRDPRLSRRNVDVPTDELLAYDLSPPRSIVLGIPPKSAELRLTTWCVVGKAELEQRFDYQLVAQWLDRRGNVLQSHPLAFQSRVSLSPAGQSASAWATRLAYATDAVTDSRTVRLKLPSFQGIPPAKLRLSAAPGVNARILIRATFAEPRLPLEISALDEAMGLLERRALVENIASVSFDWLPWSLRQTALGAWQRRLDAAGVEGKDYFVTRLLVGTGRATTGLVTAQRQAHFVHRAHALAYNVKGPLTVTLTAPPTHPISMTIGGDTTPSVLSLDENGRATLSLPDRTFPYTVVLTSNSLEPVPLMLTTEEAPRDASFGNFTRLPNDSRYELLPMIGRSTYYAANPQKPLTVAIASAQRMLGLRVRGQLPTTRGWLEASFGRERARIETQLTPSLFEQWSSGVAATDAQTLYLQLPEGVTEVNLHGTPELMVQPFALDPEIVDNRLAPEYAVELSPNTRWQYAKFDLNRDVPLRPVELSQLTADARLAELLSQSRIVGFGESTALPDHPLSPSETTPQRQLLTPYVPAREQAVPTNLTVALDRPRLVTIPAQGPLAGRAILRYRVNVPRPDQTFELYVDGQKRLQEDVLTQAAEHELVIPSGVHQIETKGFEPTDRVLLDAIPKTTDGAYRRRSVHRLNAGASLSFRFVKLRPRLRVLLTLLTEQERLLEFDWALVTREQAALAQSFTATSKSVVALATAAEGSWFWDAPTHGALRQYRERLTISDDVPNGAVTLRVRNHANSPTAYIYAVIVGQEEGDLKASPRFWTAEDPE